MKNIPLTNGKHRNFAIVDDDNYDFLMQWSWGLTNFGYVIRAQHIEVLNGKQIKEYTLMHKLILNPSPEKQTDHIDGNKLNNQRANLREATASQNLMNKPKRKGTFSSKYKGVCWSERDKKWRCYINIDKKRKSLGHFTHEEDAAMAYNSAAVKLHKEFANLNQITY